MIAKFILLFFVASPVLCCNTYYVNPNHNTLCPGQPCLTLSQYVQQSNHYFTSHTTFMFLVGDHSLHNDLALEGVTNVTLTGDNSSLPKITSKIKCTGSVYIEFDTVSKINIIALGFASCGKETLHDGAIHLTDAQDFSLSDSIFHDNAFTALSVNHSSLTLNNVTFVNNSKSALRIISCTATSIHNSTFSNNSGNHGGGAAIFNSAVSFTGTTVFESNSGNAVGLHATFAYLIFEGEIRFVSNSASNDHREYSSASSAVNSRGIYANSNTMYFEGDSSFISNSGEGGGGIFAYESTMYFVGDSSFIGNVGGGIIAINSTINFEGDSSFINNSVENSGGIFAHKSAMYFEGDSSFISNSGEGGGGITAYESTMYFEGDSSFINNNGEGIYAKSSTMNFEGESSFINNSAENGGGIFVHESTINFVGDSSFINNSAISGGGIWRFGGGIFSYNSTMKFERDSSFINNSADIGGGITAYYSTINVQGDSSFMNNSAHYIGGGIYADSVTMNFEGLNCFINNSAVYQGGGIYVDSSTMNFEGLNFFINNSAVYQGGGIFTNRSTISFKGDSSFMNNPPQHMGYGVYADSVTMTFDEGSSNNSDETGGGIFVENSTMTFEGDSSFINNSADHGGGGIFAENSTMNFEGGSSFINNSAFFGGGIYANSVIMNFEGDSSFINDLADAGGGIYATSVTMEFDDGNSSFIYNSAVSGGGIFADNITMNFYENCMCNFISNLASIDGGGIIAITNTIINFDGNCQFNNNSASYGGGIMVITSTLNFYYSCHFINNSAIYGGGIALDTSKFYLFQQHGATVYFTGNHAKRGGAITVSDSLHDLSQYCRKSDIIHIKGQCFLQINPFEPSSNINVSLFFENNPASEGGDHLYGGAIDYCDNVAEFYLNHGIDLIETLTSGLSNNKLSDISSDPIKVCVCNITDHPDCNRNVNVSTYPGESFNITIVAVGQRNGTVAAVIESVFDKESTAKLKAEENLQSSNKTCTTLTYTVFSNSSSERIDLYTEGPCGPGVGQPLSITVKLQHCPDGFGLSPTTRACICEKRLQTYTNSCDINSKTIYRSDNSDFWMGYDNETGGLILHPHCPFDYCTTADVSFTINDSDLQCNHNRSGLFCGTCQTDLSVVLGSSQCLECLNNFLALITVFAMAGLLLVSFLLICRLTVAVGTISGLIFYANIVAVNQTIFFPSRS